jgi:hypothetical protein
MLRTRAEASKGLRQCFTKKGDYAFEAGIVTISFKSESQGFLVTPFSILKRTFPRIKHIKRCIEILPLADAVLLLQSYSAWQGKE